MTRIYSLFWLGMMTTCAGNAAPSPVARWWDAGCQRWLSCWTV